MHSTGLVSFPRSFYSLALPRLGYSRNLLEQYPGYRVSVVRPPFYLLYNTQGTVQVPWYQVPYLGVQKQKILFVPKAYPTAPDASVGRAERARAGGEHGCGTGALAAVGRAPPPDPRLRSPLRPSRRAVCLLGLLLDGVLFGALLLAVDGLSGRLGARQRRRPPPTPHQASSSPRETRTGCRRDRNTHARTRTHTRARTTHARTHTRARAHTHTPAMKPSTLTPYSLSHSLPLSSPVLVLPSALTPTFSPYPRLTPTPDPNPHPHALPPPLTPTLPPPLTPTT